MDLFFFSLSRPWLLILAPLLWALLLWLDRRRRKPRRLLIACEALLPRLVPKRQQRAQTRWTLDLILLLTIALLASLVLAGPRSSLIDSTPSLKIVVLERGLTTMAGDRLATLKKLLLTEADSWPAETQVQLKLNPAGSDRPWEGEVGELPSALSQVTSLAYESSMKDRVSLFLTLPGEIVLITDKNPSLGPWLREKVRVLGQSRRCGNISLLRAGARPLNESEDLVQVTVQNASFKTRSMTVTCEITGAETGKKTQLSQGVELKEGEVKVLFQRVPGNCPELRWSVSKISHDPQEDPMDWDALELDNEQVLIRPRVDERRVRVSGDIPYEVLRALSAVEETVVEEGPPVDGVFSIVSGQVPDPLTSPSLLLLPPGSGERFLDKPSNLSWIPRDGFLLHAFETPTVAKVSIAPPSGLGELQPLLVARDGTILLGLRGQGRSLIAYCGFSLESTETNWSQQASFPLFFHGLLNTNGGHSPGLTSLPPGTVLPALEDWAGPGELEWGRVGGASVRVSSAKMLVLEQPGVYLARSEDGRERRWGVSLRPRADGFLEGLAVESPGEGKKVSAEREREESAEKGPAFFALLCIVVLIARRMNLVRNGAEGA